MATIPYEVYDNDGNVIESGTREIPDMEAPPVIAQSPNGSLWEIQVTNAGAVTAMEVP